MSDVSAVLAFAAARVVAREALLIVAQRWDVWRARSTEDAQLWLPGWTDEHRLAASPERELSLVYCGARAGLEDRVWRIRSGLSVASRPLPRTTHCVSNSVVDSAADRPEGELAVTSSWTCHVFGLKERTSHVFHGRYEHCLRADGGAWRIAAKKVVLMNDTIPTMLDFYCV
jgi:3-phenylpropionate/cinnamic acid dioxygenase small subunit